MQHKFRLTRSTDFKRVRRIGRSYAHPLVLLISAPGTGPVSRIGITAGKWVGGAVVRNRAKRLLREVLRKVYPTIINGYDMIFIARRPLPETDLIAIHKAVDTLLKRADLKLDEDDNLPIPS